MKTIIFDFDGTLVDSFKVAIEIAHQLTHRSQLVMPEEIVHLRKLRLLNVAQELKIPRWHWPFLLIRGRRMMAQRLEEVLPFPEMPALIKDLHESGYRLIVMSSNSQGNVQKVLDTRSMSQYFVQIYGGVGLLGKARALRRLMRQNKLSVNDCIYIGDEPRDIEGSKKAGMKCLSVGWGFNAPELLLEHKPLAVVNTPKDLREELRNWGKL